MADTTTADVQHAIDALIRAFGEHDTTAYFQAFSPDATFVFYTHPVPLPSREATATCGPSGRRTGSASWRAAPASRTSRSRPRMSRC